MVFRYLIILLFIALVACKVQKPGVNTVYKVKDSISVVEVPRWDTVKIDVDSAAIMALVICDSVTNKPVPVQIKARSKRASVKVKINDLGELTATANCDSLVKVIESKDKIISKLHNESNIKTEVREVYRTRWYDKLARTIALISIIILGVKFYIKFKTL